MSTKKIAIKIPENARSVHFRPRQTDFRKCGRGTGIGPRTKFFCPGSILVDGLFIGEYASGEYEEY